MRYLMLFALLALAACQAEPVSVVDDSPYWLHLPPGFPMPEIPEDNELTEARVALGKRLFYDPVLSADSSISCGSCHKQALAFADDAAISPGIHGRLGFRNSPTLANVAYLGRVNKDGGVAKLDLQAIVPIEDENEMGFSILLAADRLAGLPDYRDDFNRAYGQAPSPFGITRALGAFMRTLISGDSRYDRSEQGQESLSAAELRGQALFFSSRTDCSSCHGGFNFTDDSFRNNGLYETYTDEGRRRVTALDADIGKFRVPSLRNVDRTAPYMHDGSLASLAEVLSHYNAGGSSHANQDPLIRPLGLSPAELEDLEAFLLTLTDEGFLTDPAFAP